jgi:electron transport complex protein RnfG
MLKHPLRQHPLWQNNISQAALLLAGFALIGAVSLSGIYTLTKPKIIENERLTTLTRLNAIVPPERYDNDPVSDQIQLKGADFGSSETVTVYRARKQRQSVAAIFQVAAPEGYSGNIRLLVGVNNDQSLAGVRVITHKETPGLGDKIEVEKSAWITQFAGKSLMNPSESQWAVKKDGGEFDQFSGATITPRAVVNQTKRVLSWSQSHLAEAFNAPIQESKP